MSKPKEFKKFEDLVKQVLAVPKKELERREQEYKQQQARNKKSRPPG